MIQAGEIRIGNIVRYYVAGEKGGQNIRALPIEGMKFWSGFAHVQVGGNWRPLNTVEPVGLDDD
jgi:hypothetical protein